MRAICYLDNVHRRQANFSRLCGPPTSRRGDTAYYPGTLSAQWPRPPLIPRSRDARSPPTAPSRTGRWRERSGAWQSPSFYRNGRHLATAAPEARQVGREGPGKADAVAIQCSSISQTDDYQNAGLFITTVSDGCRRPTSSELAIGVASTTARRRKLLLPPSSPTLTC